MSTFVYVYILVSELDVASHYSGITSNLSTRLQEHNRGNCPHTSKFKPWRIETAIAFSSKAKAFAFERYLKTGESAQLFCRADAAGQDSVQGDAAAAMKTGAGPKTLDKLKLYF